MPVDATPVDGAGCVTQLPQYPGSPTPRLLAVSCSNRNVFTTQNSEESTTGAVVLSRVKSVRLPSNQLAILQHTMHTEQGVPVNVSDCLCLSDGSSSIADSSSAAACAYAIKFTLQESLSFELTCPIVDVTAEVVDGDKGLVQIQLTPEQLRYPGVYMGQFSLVQLAETEADYDTVILSNMFYVIAAFLVVAAIFASGAGHKKTSDLPA